MTTKMKLSTKALRWLRTHGKNPKAIPTMALISVGDFFIPALPTQTSVMLLAWLQRKRGALIAFMFAFAAATGAAVLAAGVTFFNDYLNALIPSVDSEHHAHWLYLEGVIKQYGIYGLAFMSLLPTPPRSLIVLSILAGLAIEMVILAVFVGKFIWFSLVVLLVIYTPIWLTRLPIIGQYFTRMYIKLDH